MESNRKQEVSQQAMDDIVAFYNANEDAFIDFEHKWGINLWFLNHFRTYYSYRNALFEAEKADKNELSSQADNKLSAFTILGRLLREFMWMLRKYKKPQQYNSDYVMISNAADIIKGWNRRFGDLEMDRLYNRTLFDIKLNVTEKDFAPSRQNSTDSIFLNYLFRFSFVKDVLQFHKAFHQLTQAISGNKTAKHNTVAKIFGKNRLFFYLSYLRYKSLEVYFKDLQIKGIWLSDENSPQQKMIQYAAKKNGIRVYAFQHGNIHPLHPAYIYGQYNQKPLLPDITFTWGTYFTDLLIAEGGFRSDQLKTVGRILPSKPDRKINPKINKEDKIILFASQPQRDANMRARQLKDIIWSVKELHPRYKLVIRPHPREKDDSYFRDIAKELDFQDFMIDRETDLKTHFEICDILIVAFSTVGTEFIQHFKPMIVLDYLNQDLIQWIKEGVGIPVHNREELFASLSNEELKVNRESYQKFIEKYYIADANVLERVKDTIRNL